MAVHDDDTACATNGGRRQQTEGGSTRRALANTLFVAAAVRTLPCMHLPQAPGKTPRKPVARGHAHAWANAARKTKLPAPQRQPHQRGARGHAHAQAQQWRTVRAHPLP
jgi:hypothetical protein